jgi:hypothetical protein
MSTGFATERAGDLLLHLHHANVPFGQIVIKGDAEVVHKSQGFVPGVKVKSGVWPIFSMMRQAASFC